MSNGGTWEPPQTDATPPPPPPPGDTPTAPLEPTRPRRSRGPVIAAIVGAIALVGAGVFAVSRLAGDSSSGGADTPEDAGLAFLAAMENEDILGVIDVLLPGERNTLHGPVEELVAELSRLEVLSDAADPEAVSGIAIELEDESVEVTETNVEDIVNLTISATGTASLDGEALPIGDLLLEETDVEPAELSEEAGEPEELTIPITAVREDGRWYLSAFYTIAEELRRQTADTPDIPAEGVAPTGGETPEEAMDNLLEGIEALDLTRIIGALNPDEFQALQRYALLFLDDAQTALDDADVTVSVDAPEYTVSGDGETRSVTISYLRFTLDVEGEPATVTLEDGCWSVDAGDESVNLCEAGDEMRGLDEIFEDPQPVEDLIAAFQDSFADYENPGFIVEEVDDSWYFSPMATSIEQLLAVMKALTREEIEELGTTISDAMEQLENVEVFGSGDVLSADDDVAADAPGTTVFDDSAVEDDPTDDCYGEDDALAAAACFQALVDDGTIEPFDMPIFLRFPDCGLAEVFWSGDFYSLPDAEFMALVNEAAPCFQTEVAAGEIDELDLPVELSHPECLQDRNFYVAAEEEDEYFEAVNECAYG